jgi:hypothetical protein
MCTFDRSSDIRNCDKLKLRKTIELWAYLTDVSFFDFRTNDIVLQYLIVTDYCQIKLSNRLNFVYTNLFDYFSDFLSTKNKFNYHLAFRLLYC